MESARRISREAPIHFNPEGNYGVGFLGSAVPLMDGGGEKSDFNAALQNPGRLAAAPPSGPVLFKRVRRRAAR